MLKQLDWVIVADTCPEVENRGRTGYVIGQVQADLCGVYFAPTDLARAGLGEFICFDPADLIPTGQIEPPRRRDQACASMAGARCCSRCRHPPSPRGSANPISTPSGPRM